MNVSANNEELIQRIKDGDEEAKSIFVEKNSPLVYSIVRRFSRQRIAIDDLSLIHILVQRHNGRKAKWNVIP